MKVFVIHAWTRRRLFQYRETYVVTAEDEAAAKEQARKLGATAGQRLTEMWALEWPTDREISIWFARPVVLWGLPPAETPTP